MRAAHLGSSGSPERHSKTGLASTSVGFAGRGSGHRNPASTSGADMQSTTVSATALEKLKRQAKSHRDITGQTHSEALEFVARKAGFSSWKHVTSLAAIHRPSLMPASHRHLLVWVDDGSPRMRKCSTVEELCEALGGVEPVLFRSHCHESRLGARCFCEMDPEGARQGSH